MNRCKVCNCKLRSGDICQKCKYEAEWLQNKEYFCTSTNCQRLLYGATESGLCEKCKKEREKPSRPPEEATKNENMEENNMGKPHKTEKFCENCGNYLTKNGHCFSCAMKGKRNRAKGQSNQKKAAESKETPKKVTEMCCKCYAKAPLGLLRNTPDGLICPVCAGEYDKPAPEVSHIAAEAKPWSLPAPVIDKPVSAFLPISIKELQRMAYENAVLKGWHDEKRSPAEMICLMHSELSEALEELRNNKQVDEIYFNQDNANKPEGVPIELADAVIRIFDFCGAHNIDLQFAIISKMIYNQNRSYRHGGKKL